MGKTTNLNWWVYRISEPSNGQFETCKPSVHLQLGVKACEAGVKGTCVSAAPTLHYYMWLGDVTRICTHTHTDDPNCMFVYSTCSWEIFFLQSPNHKLLILVASGINLLWDDLEVHSIRRTSWSNKTSDELDEIQWWHLKGWMLWKIAWPRKTYANKKAESANVGNGLFVLLGAFPYPEFCRGIVCKTTRQKGGSYRGDVMVGMKLALEY